MLEVKNLSLTKNDKVILKDLSLEIPKTRATLLLGKSGSGKTTLLRCIAQLEARFQGDILYRDQPINQLAPKERCQTVGFISQAFSLFPHLNVLDNCARALRVFGSSKGDAYACVKKTLQLLDMEQLALSFPHQMSGGQQQRAAIARALVLKPAFLLFDEPTSALDPENTERFVAVIRNLLQAETGVVIASQDMNLAAKLLDLTYFLEEGSFTEKYDAQEKSLSEGSRIFHFLNMK